MRKLLMLDVAEAADLIGNATPRAWQRWESGDRSIPDDVKETMFSLIQDRNEMISDLTQWQYDNEGALLKMKYYHAFEQFEAENKGTTKIDWRLHQAVVSFIFSEGGEVELI